ncbi:MAG: hypothetical protein KDJ50_07850, partial [Alphaproteobacteria bacterium]|nr:hypothetical protein [Alphaproteobacteria bacterium]
WALTSFKNVKLMEKGAVMADVPVVLSDTKTLQIVAGEGYFATVPSFAKGSGNVTVTYKSPAIAPIKEGDVLGSASFKLPDGSLKKIPLIAKSDAPQASFFSRMAEKLMIMLVGVPE